MTIQLPKTDSISELARFWDTHDIRDIISEPRREHSRKPEAFYELIDKNFVGRKLDYFSRQVRPGWEVMGNDVNKFDDGMEG